MSNHTQPLRLGVSHATGRGFPGVKFQDAYLESCTLQCSSAIDANAEEMPLPGASFVWLGVDHVVPQILATDAARLGIRTTETTGWVPFPIPKEVLLNGRMHLNRLQVAGLIDRLQQWLDTGAFEDAAELGAGEELRQQQKKSSSGKALPQTINAVPTQE